MAQNLIPYSNAFVTQWTNTEVTTVANSANSTAPDGTSTAVEFKESGTLSIHRVTTTATVTIGKVYTFSIFIKKGTRTFAALQYDSGSRYGNVNLNTGETLPGSVLTTMTAKLLADNWVRVDITTSLTTGGNVYVYPATGLSFADITYQGVAGDISMYIWQAQLVRANWAGDLQPTIGTPYTAPIRDIVLKQNLLLNSEDFSNASWGKLQFGSSVSVVTADQVLAPDGTMTADRIAIPNVNVGAGVYSVVFNLFSIPTIVGKNYVFSVWLRGEVGGELVYISQTPNGVNYSSKPCPLTTTWQRFEVSYVQALALAYCLIGVDQRDGAQTGHTAQNIYAWGAQLVKANWAGDYQPTTTTAITNPIRDIVKGQNLLKYSQEFDNPVWGVGNIGGSISANSVIAPDGTLTADRWTFPTATGGAFNFGAQILTATNASLEYTFSVWLKCPSGTQTFALVMSDVNIKSVGGATLTATTVWQRFDLNIPKGTLNNTTFLGVAIGGIAAGNLIDVWGFQLVKANHAGDYTPTVGTAITNPIRDIVKPQNLLAYSENFLNAMYSTYFTVPVATTDTLDPQGNTAAYKLSEAINTDYHYWYQGGATPLVLANGVYTASVYMKAGTSRYVSLYNGQLAGAVASFDLVLGTVTFTVGTQYLNSSIVPLSNGWFRLSLTATNFGRVGIFMNTTSGTLPSPHLGDTSRNVYFFGYQLVKGNHAGDYAYTNGTAINNPIRNAVLKQNLLRSSDISAVYTTKVGTPTITGGQLAPDGTLTAFNVSSANATTYLQQQVVRNLVIGKNYVTSIWMKADTNCNVGMEFIDVGDGNPAYSVTQAVTPQWQQFSISSILGATAGIGAMGLIVGSRFALWPTARTITMWHPQIVEANWAGDDCPTSGVIIDNPIRNVV